MNNKPIYLDYAATCPMDPRVATKMQEYLTIDGTFGNPASASHVFGWQAAEAVDVARNQIATAINAEAHDIIFTSGATESNNLALIGYALANQAKGKHIITTAIEHKSILDSAQYLETLGFSITYLPVDHQGLIDLNQLADTIRNDTILVSVMLVNNEIGVIQDVNSIAKICQQKGITLHIDATQALGKLPIDLQQLPADLMSISAHKVYGPKGIGVLFVRKSANIKLTALIHGGGHEMGLRSGTLATQQIVGMGEAVTLAIIEMPLEVTRIKKLRDYLMQELLKIDKIQVNGSLQQRVAHNLNISCIGLNDTDIIINHFTNIAVSSGSACNSEQQKPSYVLKAIGLSDNLAYNAIRFSLGRFTTLHDINQTIQHVKDTIQLLRL